MTAPSRAYFPSSIGNAVVMAFGFVPFAVSAWAIVAWLIWRQSLTGFLSLFVVVPLLFLELAIFGFVLWLRPSIRTARKLPIAEGSWYLGAIAAWLAGVSTPGAVGGILQLVAIAVSAFGIWWCAKRSQQENIDNMTARAQQMRDHLRTGSPEEPQPRVITVDEEWTVQEGPGASGRDAVDAEIIDDNDEDESGPEWIARPRGE